MAAKNTMTINTFKMRKKILELLRDGMTSRELSDSIKLPISTTNPHLIAMVEDGSIKRLGHKVYRGTKHILYKSILDSYELCGRTLFTGVTNSPVLPSLPGARIILLTETTMWAPKTPPKTGLYKRVVIGSTFGMM